MKILSTHPFVGTTNIMIVENANSNTHVNTVLTTKPIFLMIFLLNNIRGRK